SHAFAITSKECLLSGSLKRLASSRHFSAFRRYCATRSVMRPIPLLPNLGIDCLTYFRYPSFPSRAKSRRVAYCAIFGSVSNLIVIVRELEHRFLCLGVT